MVPPLVLTKHLRARLAERSIPLDWVERIALKPEWTERDRRDPEIIRAFGRIKEARRKVLRVAYADRPDGRYVLSAHFDEMQTRRHGRCG
jgi:Domain of unknown function (DUF4258)